MKKLLFCILLLYVNLIQSQNTQWAFKIGNSNKASEGLGIATDNQGNVFVAGHFTGTVDFDPSDKTTNLTSTPPSSTWLSERSDAFIAKYSEAGKLIWAKSFGGDSYDKATSLAVDSSGNIIVIGDYSNTVDLDPSDAKFELSSKGNTDIFVAKYDTDGNFIWGKSFGGSGEEVSDCKIKLDKDDNIYFAGGFIGTVDFDPSENVANLSSTEEYFDQDGFFAKIDKDGNYKWANKIGGGSSSEELKGIAIDTNLNVYVAGKFGKNVDFDPSNKDVYLSAVDSDDIYFAKYNKDGNYIWAKQLGGRYTGEYVEGLSTDSDNNVYLLGGFKRTMDFDPSGSTSNLKSKGDDDTFIAKYDTDGKYVWAKSFGGNRYDQAADLQIDEQNNLYITGRYFGKKHNFNPDKPKELFSSKGSADIFLVKLDSKGVFSFARSMGGRLYDQPFAITSDKKKNVYLTGGFKGQANFGTTDKPLNISPAGSTDNVFVVKIKQEQSKNPVVANTCDTPQATIDENFDSYPTGNIPSCWNILGGAYSSGGLRNKPDNSHSGTKYLFAYNAFNSSGYVYFVCPKLSTIDGKHRATFYIKGVGQNGENVSMNYGTMSSNKDVSTFVPFGKSFESTSSYKKINTGAVPKNGNQYFAIRAKITTQHTALYIDDFKWEKMKTAGIDDFQLTDNTNSVVYPNPLEGNRLYIRLKDVNPGENYSVALYDTEGRKIIKKTLNMDKRVNSIEVPNLSSGIYMIEIRYQNKIEHKRIIVK